MSDLLKSEQELIKELNNITDIGTLDVIIKKAQDSQEKMDVAQELFGMLPPGTQERQKMKEDYEMCSGSVSRVIKATEDRKAALLN